MATTANFSFGGISSIEANISSVAAMIMLHSNREQALEEYRLSLILNKVKDYNNNIWSQYIIDRCNGKMLPVSTYTSDNQEQMQLSKLDECFRFCAEVRRIIDESAPKGKKKGLAEVLINYDQGELLSELLPLSDTDFCMLIQKLHKQGHLSTNVGPTELHKILLCYFDTVPSISMLGVALREEYDNEVIRRSPRNKQQRVRKDILNIIHY